MDCPVPQCEAVRHASQWRVAAQEGRYKHMGRDEEAERSHVAVSILPDMQSRVAMST